MDEKSVLLFKKKFAAQGNIIQLIHAEMSIVQTIHCSIYVVNWGRRIYILLPTYIFC